MKKIVQQALILSSGLLLAACSALPPEEGGEGQANQNQTGQEANFSQEVYRPVVRDGTYQPSQSRGVTTRLNSAVNIKSFEEGLMEIAQNYYSTDDHYFEEGQYISRDVIDNWLGRQSEDNPDGLNPPDNNETDENARNPRYISSILEQDYYVQTDEGLELSGIVIGLGMNSIDYYQKEQFGTTYETAIDRETILNEGKRMADEMLAKIREVEDLQDVEIVFAIYEQAPRDDLAGGVYLAEGSSSSGESVNNWSNLSREKYVFPLEGENVAEANSFSNFKSEVENFFPNLAGVTGVATYDNGQLVNLEVNITTQFYGQGEIIAFTQYVSEAAETYLPANIPISITVESVNNIEAILYRDQGESAFTGKLF